MLIVVNYHYIRPAFDNPYPSIFGITPSQLKSQLEILGKVGIFVSSEQIRDAISGVRDLPRRAILVTFDDGLKEQFENARPVLKGLGIPAIFFVNTAPIAGNTVSQVHKLHILRAEISAAEFRAMLERHASFMGMDLSIEGDSAEARAQYPYDTPENAQLKYFLNFVLPLPERDQIIETCFNEIFPEREARISKGLYMDPEQVKTLADEGCLGTHGHQHLPLGLLPAPVAEEQLGLSLSCLKEWTGDQTFALSYPYGSRDACSAEVGRIATELGISFAFTMERAGNSSLANPLHLARFDSNDLPGGSSSMFTLANLFETVPVASWYQ